MLYNAHCKSEINIGNFHWNLKSKIVGYTNHVTKTNHNQQLYFHQDSYLEMEDVRFKSGKETSWIIEIWNTDLLLASQMDCDNHLHNLHPMNWWNIFECNVFASKTTSKSNALIQQFTTRLPPQNEAKAK